MSLEGAKIICLNDVASGQNEIISAQGRTFKFGYYMDCDVVLEHPDAMGLQCTIDCDAFGRVTIENRCPDQTVTLNGEILKKMRPLLNNTEICIFDKKFLWQFEGKPKSGGFQMEDVNDFITPCKQTKKAEQPPNSEPARRWRTQFNKRLTIHSFAYCIKANESPKDVEITTDENKPLNTYERIIPVDLGVPHPAPTTIKRLSVSPPPIAADLIDLKTPKARQRSLACQRTPLSCCKLSETVITSYSPRETGVRPEKSFALVQSPAQAPAKSTAIPDVSLGTFQHLPPSPLTVSHRPSMHLIDLTTPKKRVLPFSPAKTLLKSTLKKNIPTTSAKLHQRRSIAETITTSMESVYSVPSTDEESVIELSDEGHMSPSPAPKTPRRKTPQSLMKHAIISSAKKAEITKRLNLAEKQNSPRLMFTPPGAGAVRFQSQSTPQRKSLGRLQSPRDSQKATQSVAGKAAKSMFTSTPFRAGESATSKRSILRTPSTSLTGVKNKSRTSLMLKHALSKSPQTSSAKKRKSVSFIEATKSLAVRERKSVSFLDRIEREGNQSLNRTFSIEEENSELPKKDATFSPEKEKLPSSEDRNGSKEARLSLPTIIITDEKVCSSPPKTEMASVSKVPATDKAVISPETNSECLVSHSAVVEPRIDSAATRPADTTNAHELSASQTPQSSRDRPKQTKTAPIEKLLPNMDVMEDDDFEGLDTIFKTPKAKNLMILGSPKSISLQKPTSDSVELIHSTEFDLSANLDDIFKTPQSEFIVNRVEEEATPSNAENMEPYSPEEAFDLLVGRPITRKTYANKTTPPKQDVPPLNVSRDNSLPKTDIEEWIDNVNNSIEILEEDDDYHDFTATQNEFSRDPLLTSSVSGSGSTTNKTKRFTSPKDESVMTIEEELDNTSALKDPLQMTSVSASKKSPSPNISGIDLLDHTSESLFSETLEVSDESSGKESDKTIEQVDDDCRDDANNADENINISPDKARREMEEAFKNFEKERKMLEVNRLVSTPEPVKPVARVNRRKTMGSQQTLHAYFDVKLFKEERDMEIAFENFKKEPTTGEPRLCKTPDVQRAVRNEWRKTMVNPVGGELDVNAIKAEREMELAFENFNEKPGYVKDRVVQTPEPAKVHFNDHRRTMGSASVTEMTLDLEAAKTELEMQQAFENFEDEPEFSQERAAQTPEPKKTTMKDHRRTMGSNLVTEVKLDLEAAKAQLEMEQAFENFEDEPEFAEERSAQTPEPKKTAMKDHRRTMGSSLVTEVTLDLEAAKTELEMQQAFENFEDEPEFSQERAAQTPEPKKAAMKDHRRTMGSNLVTEVTLDLEAAKTELEMQQAFANFEDEPEFSQERAAQTPEPKKTAMKDHRRTMGSNLVTEVTLDLEAAKAQLEMEQAFANFEDEPEFSQERAAQTPEPKKTAMKDHRRTMGSNLVTEVTLDLEAAKTELEMQQAFENFEDEPEFSQERAAQTPEPKKTAMKDHRRTMGTNLVTEVTLDLEAAKTELEMEQAFENFEDEPEFSQERAAQTPEPKKTAMKDHRRTMGSNLVTEVTLDLEAAKAQLEMDQAFENFEVEPEFSQERAAQTPEPKKTAMKDHRRTMGSNLVTEVTLDLEAAKTELEMQQAFENFEDEPEFSQERAAQTPEPKKTAMKDHRRTMGSNLVTEVTLDLEAAKAQLEMDQAFENFEVEPEFSQERAAQTPEPKKTAMKDHRRTMGSNLVTEVTLDLEAAKTELEMQQAFENFEDAPEFSQERAAQTPEPKKTAMKDHRRTMGSNLVTEVTLDLEAAKTELEMEQAFANFEDEPEFSQERAAQTPEPKKTAMKDHRRTMGSNLVTEVTLDLQAAKAQLEMDQAFENFEDEPEFSQERAAQTPEPKKTAMKDHRRTMGSNLVTEVTLDLEAAKAQLEMEQAFENFEDEPEFPQERAAQTPEPKKTAMKDHRRTMGSNLVTEVTLDLEAAKAQLEMDQAFENFEDEPEFSQERAAQTPEPKKTAMKDHRRTMGSNLVTVVTLDLEAAKTELEMEQAFANFEDEPEFSQERAAQTPEPKKTAMKDHRRTMGSNLVTEVTLDLQAAKAQLEMEQAFENFEDEPEFSQERAAQTPEPKKTAMKDHRRTMGSNLVTEVTLDLESAKAELEMEQAFENFEDEPEFSQERAAQTPEPKKTAMKDHRRTMGSNLVTEVTLDLQTAKAELEMEQAFENFEDEPEFSQERSAQTPEPKKTAMKDHRRTMGSNLVTEVTLDLEAAKAQLEMDQAFANFEDEPEFSQERSAQTPEPKKTAMKDHRRTMGSNLVTEVTLDLQAAKAQLEMEQAFENFEDEPEFPQERAAQTPEPKKTAMKDHRRTMGSNLVTEVTLDLEAAKAQLEMDQAFENFEDEPEFSQERAAQTPEPKKTAMKDHRRTMGSNLVTVVTLDLEAAKTELEMEQAFANFEDEPEFSQERAAQTPEPKKTAMKDHRRTMGSNLVTEVTLDLQAAKAQLEMEQAFENFEDEPEFSQERAAQTPEPKKTAMKDHRRTMGSNLVTEVTLDLESAKAELEMEQAFENFEDEPEFSQERAAQTPEPKKTAMKDHRRTMGSNLVTEVTLDLQTAKAELEMEQAFENFEDEPEFSQERSAQTPEPKKTAMKDHRRTMGSNLVTEVTLDLEAAKAQLEMDQAFANFEDEPEFSQERSAQTPEPKKTAMKDHRRTMGSNLVTEVTLDLQAAKAQLEMEQAFENFEDEPEFSQERAAQTPEPKKNAMKDHRRTMGTNLVTEVTLDLEAANAELIIKQASENFDKDPTAERFKSTEAAAFEPSIRKENAELVPVLDINCAEDTCETNEVVAVSDSDDAKSKQQISEGHREEPATKSKPRSIRKRQQSVDEVNKCKEEVITQTALNEHTSVQPRARRRRQNTIDEVLEDKSNLASDTDIGTIVPSQPKSRRRRQPTIDDVDQLKKQDETPQMQSRTRRGRLNSVDAGSSLKDEHNHRSNDLTPQQPQTEIEKDTPLKREDCYHSSEADFTTSLSTKATAITTDEEIHKQLEPIAEEDKLIAAQIDDGANDAAQSGADQIRENQTSSKSVLNLNAEVDEIASTPHKSSSSRVRGRTAQLSVVLVQSKDKSSPSVHSPHADEIKIEADVKSETSAEDQNDPTAAGNDADEVIQCTPAPTKTRGRRPAHKVELPAPSPALRRGRRGSVDVKVVEHVVSTTPLQTKLRGRKGLLKEESTDASSSPAVDLIPPTPELKRPRGRRAAIKVESNKTTAENVTPSRNRSGQGADAIHRDEVTEAPAESVTEEENQRRSTHEIHTAAVVPTVPLTVQVLPVRKRGRKKANADAEVPPDESDVAVKEKEQMGSVEDADSNKNEVTVPLSAEKSPVRKRGRKKAVADPNISTDQTDVPPKESSTEIITSQRRSDVQRSETHADKVASAPTEPSGEEKRKSLKGTDIQASETSVSSAAPRKRGRRANNADPVSLTVTPETEPLSDKGELIESDVKAPAPASKRGRKKAVQDTNTNPDVMSVSPTEDVSSPKNIEPIIPSAATSEPLKSTTEDPIPVDDFQANAEEVAPNPEPPKKRGRNPKLANSVSDALTPNVSQSTQLPISTRGRRGLLKSESVETDAESPAPKRARKKVIDAASGQITASESTEEVDDSEKVTDLQQDQTGSEETAPSTPVPTKPRRGRRPALKAELIRPASSTPVRGRGQRGADVVVEETVLPVKIEPTTESATGGRKRGRKAAEKEAPAEEITVKSEPIEPAVVAAQPGGKRGRRVVVQSEILTEDDDVEKVIPSEQQTQQEASTSEPTESLSKSEPNDNIPAKKRGRPAAVKSEPTTESSTPVRKRGRKAAAKDEDEPTDASAKGVPADNLDLEEPPSGARRLPAILKESAAESVTPRQRKARNPAISKCEEESADLDQAPVKPEATSSTRPIRSQRASAKEVVEEKPIAPAEEKLPPVSEESEKKPTRGRKAKPKKDATVDSTAPHTEEELPPTPIKTKPTRGRKPTVKADISSTNEKSQIEDTNKSKRGRKPNPTETGTPSKDEVEGTPVSTRKTTRNKVGAQIESLNSEGNQPVKKTTRGRKAAASNSDDGHSSPPRTPKNQTRSRKVPQPVAKRAIQQHMEITAEDDQDCTPSKRIRRKPNILLSDEFVH